MGRIILILMLSVSMVGVATPPVGTSEDDIEHLCPGYELELRDGEGDLYLFTFHACYGENRPNLHLGGWGDRAESLELAHASTGQGVTFYDNPSYGGASWRVCGNTYRPTLGWWKDKISSFRWTNTCPQ